MQPQTLTPPVVDQPPTRGVVAIESLTKRYGEHVAVDSLTFDVPAGHVVGLLGPNGAGKTTAMKMLVGLVRPSGGRASVLGADTQGPEFRHALRRVGALIEAPGLYGKLSARRNLELQARALGIAPRRGRIDELLTLVDLAGRADDRAGSYSLGMKQRLGIAVAMVGNPELVILDEPANGLDPAGIVEIRHLLRRLPSMGTTVLVSSHQLAEVQQACDSVVVLSEGRLVASGTTDDIVKKHQTSLFTARIGPDDVLAARATLSDHGIAITDVSHDSIVVELPTGWSGRDLNHVLVGGGVYADELAPNVVSLEEAFLAMTGAHHES